MEFFQKLKFDGNLQKLYGIFQKVKLDVIFQSYQRMKFRRIFQT